MKASAFPKLDRPPRRPPKDPPRIAIRDTTVTKQDWIRWRISLGAGRKEALKLWHHFREWAAQEASQPRPRVLRVLPWQNWEREFRAFLDEMPRKPFKFLAMVAEAEKRAARQAMLAERKAVGRERYLRQFNRRAPS